MEKINAGAELVERIEMELKSLEWKIASKKEELESYGRSIKDRVDEALRHINEDRAFGAAVQSAAPEFDAKICELRVLLENRTVLTYILKKNAEAAAKVA